MRAVRLTFILFTSFSLCGCLSMNTIDAAKGHPRTNDAGDKVATHEPKPALYLLLPVTFPIDAVFYPIEFMGTAGMSHGL
jgi:hypothetical protein